MLRKDNQSLNQGQGTGTHHLRSLEKIRERVHQLSASHNPIVVDHEVSSAKDLLSHDSRADGFFF